MLPLPSSFEPTPNRNPGIKLTLPPNAVRVSWPRFALALILLGLSGCSDTPTTDHTVTKGEFRDRNLDYNFKVPGSYTLTLDTSISGQSFRILGTTTPQDGFAPYFTVLDKPGTAPTNWEADLTALISAMGKQYDAFEEVGHSVSTRNGIEVGVIEYRHTYVRYKIQSRQLLFARRGRLVFIALSDMVGRLPSNAALLGIDSTLQFD